MVPLISVMIHSNCFKLLPGMNSSVTYGMFEHTLTHIYILYIEILAQALNIFFFNFIYITCLTQSSGRLNQHLSTKVQCFLGYVALLISLCRISSLSLDISDQKLDLMEPDPRFLRRLIDLGNELNKFELWSYISN